MSRKRFDDIPSETERPYNFIDDDCRVKECNEGFIFAFIDGYSTVYSCPMCDRSKRMVNWARIRKYPDTVTYFTEMEMNSRREERKEIYITRQKKKIPALDLAETI